MRVGWAYACLLLHHPRVAAHAPADPALPAACHLSLCLTNLPELPASQEGAGQLAGSWRGRCIPGGARQGAAVLQASQRVGGRVCFTQPRLGGGGLVRWRCRFTACTLVDRQTGAACVSPSPPQLSTPPALARSQPTRPTQAAAAGRGRRAVRGGCAAAHGHLLCRLAIGRDAGECMARDSVALPDAGCCGAARRRRHSCAWQARKSRAAPPTQPTTLLISLMNAGVGCLPAGPHFR